MNAADHYFSAALAALDAARKTQTAQVQTAARWIADAIAADHLLFVTGSGHSHMLAEEVFYRAGGLAAVYPILDPGLMLHDAALASTQLERVEGIATVRLESAGVGPGDVLLIASNSGRNAFPVEAALEGKRRGAKIIALTSLQHSQSVTSRHSSGQRLFEIADLVLDTGVPAGDAAVELNGLDLPVGPLSTVAGAALMNAVMVQVVANLLATGHTPPVFRSANVGSDFPAEDVAQWSARIPPLR